MFFAHDFPITKIWNKKYNCLFHIYMLKLNEDRMNAIHVQHHKLTSFIVLFATRTKFTIKYKENIIIIGTKTTKTIKFSTPYENKM
jgi:hypothetical protein